MPLPKLPVTGLDDPNHVKRVRETLNKVLDHQFDDSKVMTSAEKVAGTPVVNFGYRPGLLKRWASGNGTSDDTDAIQAAIDSGLPIDDYGDATYRITQKLIIPATGVLQIRGKVRLRPDLNGAGSLYAWDNATTQTAGQGDTAFLAVSARQGARTVQCNTVTGMLVGDLFYIRTQTAWDYDSTIFKGELNRILDINAGTKVVTLQNPLNCEYNTAVDASYVYTYTPKIVDIDGLEIEHASYGTLGGGLGLAMIADSRIRNVSMKNCGLVGISLVNCYNVLIEGCGVVDGYVSGLGYGVQSNQSTLISIVGGTFRNNRHGIDFSGEVPCHECNVIGATVIGNTAEGSCVGSHGGGNRLSFIGNKLSNSLVGVQSRSPNTMVVGNQYHGCASFVVHYNSPGLIVTDNTQVVNSIEPVVGTNQLADNFFLELGTASNPDNEIFDVNVPTAEMIIARNVCQPTDDFIICQSTVTKMRRIKVYDNDINFQGTSHKFINGDAAGTVTVSGDSSFFAPNNIKVSTGSYTALSNVAITNPTAYNGDTTPSVIGAGAGNGGIIYIANTGATVISAFDDGLPGQEITVFVNDALTTIDFTGTSLRGNGNADYNPGANFVLRGKFDGNKWYCTVATV